MKLALRALSILSFVLLISCSTSQRYSPPTQTTISTVIETAIPTSTLLQLDPTPTSTPTPTPTPLQRTQYTLHAHFDYNAQHLKVEQSVLFTNNTAEALTELIFLVEAHLFPNCFSLNSLNWEDDTPIVNYKLDSNQLLISLQQSLQPGQHIKINLIYSLNMPENLANTARPLPFGYTTRQTNLVDWYPILPPYQQGKGWLAHPPGYYGEHDVYDIADYEVFIETINPPANLIIAASSLPDQQENIYHYQFLNARNFVWSASTMYQVYETQVGDVTIRSYSFPFNPAAGQQALKDTALAVQLASDLFAPYPHHLLSVVEADFLDGMEYDGLFFLSRGFYNSDVVPRVHISP